MLSLSLIFFRVLKVIQLANRNLHSTINYLQNKIPQYQELQQNMILTQIEGN